MLAIDYLDNNEIIIFLVIYIAHWFFFFLKISAKNALRVIVWSTVWSLAWQYF